MPKLTSVNCKKTSQQLPLCVITTTDSLFFKNKNFSKKLFTSKIKRKEEAETKSSVWDLKMPKLAQILESVKRFKAAKFIGLLF